jgi:membrane protein DedA with SNARE-associated domain
LNFWIVIAVASIGSVAGDQAGYAIGRWGGKALVRKISRMLGDENRLRELDAKAVRWGAPGVFFSRWLVAALGPWINLASGAAGYSWLKFTIWDVAGETFGAVLFIGLGEIFSDRVQAISAFIGDLSWAIVAFIAAAFLGWKLFFRR